MNRAMVVSILLAGCTRPNPQYCDSHADCANGELCDVSTHSCTAVSDANMSCTTDEQCVDPLAPVCDAQQCRACVLDDECSSRVCNPDGACAASATVLYVDPNGVSAGECSATSPCELSYAIGQITPERFAIRLANGTYSLPTTILLSSPLDKATFVGGRGAVFQRTSSGPVFDVRNGTSVTLRGMSFNRGIECDRATLSIARVAFGSPDTEVRPWLKVTSCSTTVTDSEFLNSTTNGVDALFSGTLSIAGSRIGNSAGNGISAEITQLEVVRSEIFANAKLGIDATSQFVSIHRSLIIKNVKGGVSSVGGVFDVTNNFVIDNGDRLDCLVGGMRLDSTLPGNRVEHNTIVENEREYGTAPVYAGGLFCRGGGTGANNLIVANRHGNAEDPSAQIGGTCNLTGSIIAGDAIPYKFVRQYPPPPDYHLAEAASAAVNVGLVTSLPLAEDFDGDPRSDGMPDVGADEFVP